MSLYYPNMAAFDAVRERWKEFAFEQIPCERCKMTIVEKGQYYHMDEQIVNRSKKGRLLFYCSRKCQEKHHHGYRCSN